MNISIWIERMFSKLGFVKKKESITCKEFSPHLQWQSIDDIPFEEAVDLIDWCIDDPVLYCNTPTKARQAWQHIQFLALIGEKCRTEQKAGTLLDWAATVK